MVIAQKSCVSEFEASSLNVRGSAVGSDEASGTMWLDPAEAVKMLKDDEVRSFLGDMDWHLH